MSRPRTIPSHDFSGMNAEDMAALVEADIKALARKWKYHRAEGKRTLAICRNAATETAALYLQANHDLYFREEHQAIKDAHQNWMMLIQEWFLSVVEKKR